MSSFMCFSFFILSFFLFLFQKLKFAGFFSSLILLNHFPKIELANIAGIFLKKLMAIVCEMSTGSRSCRDPVRHVSSKVGHIPENGPSPRPFVRKMFCFSFLCSNIDLHILTTALEFF